MYTFSTNLRGKVRNFPLPKDRPLVPLYEAIVNSIHAINERIKNTEQIPGFIEIEVIRDRTLFYESDSNTVRGFSIRDNGVGFDESNMKSFMESDSERKMEIGGWLFQSKMSHRSAAIEPPLPIIESQFHRR